MSMPQSRLRPWREPRLTYFPLVLVAGAVSAGIVLDRGREPSFKVSLLTAAALLFVWLGLWLAGRERMSSCCLLLSIAAAGAGWHHAYWRLYPAREISLRAREIGTPCCVEAVALTSPRLIPEPPRSPLHTIPVGERCELLLRIEAVRDGVIMRPACGRAEVTVAGHVEGIRAGDRLRIFAHLARSQPPLNPGEFDFAAHQRGLRANCRMSAGFPECVERIAAGSVWSPRRWLADVRAGGVEILRRHIAPERAGLAAAVLLGAREQLDPDRNEDYLVTGTVHVLSVSGLHVGILAGMFFWLLNTGVMSRRTALLGTMLLTVLYAVLTGLEPPIVRATILVSAACLAFWSGRSTAGPNTLAGALLIVLALNPASLFQIGTQLSFLAVATMIVFARVLMKQPIADPLDRLILNTRPWPQKRFRALADDVWRLWLTGALIWVVSAPLVWWRFHLISPAALVLSVLIWLPMTLAMYFGMLTLCVGSILPAIADFCGQACDACLWCMELFIAAGRDWPASYDWLPGPPTAWVAVFYLVVGSAFLWPPLRPGWRWSSAAIAAWSAVALFAAVPMDWSQRPLTCHFVAVGHGLGVLVELPNGRNLLYDAGRMGSPVSAMRPVASVLWSRGITRLDALVISHADADHYNGIPGLLERFPVGAIYVSPVMFDERAAALTALKQAIGDSGTPIREIHGGQRLDASGDTTIEVLHPPRKGVDGSDNANSIVLAIESSKRRVLLTGDLESPGLEDVLAEQPLRCDVVLAPHHGSPRSSPGVFADWCRPKHVVISGGRSLGDERTVEAVKNSFRLRGAEVYHTAQDGCIRVTIDGSGIAVSTHRPHVRAVPTAGAGAKLLQAE